MYCAICSKSGSGRLQPRVLQSFSPETDLAKCLLLPCFWDEVVGPLLTRRRGAIFCAYCTQGRPRTAAQCHSTEQLSLHVLTLLNPACLVLPVIDSASWSPTVLCKDDRAYTPSPPRHWKYLPKACSTQKTTHSYIPETNLWNDVGQRRSKEVMKACRPKLGAKISKTNWFSQAFRASPRYPSPNSGIFPPKMYFPWASRNIPNFLAPIPSHERPLIEDIRIHKFEFGVPLSYLKSRSNLESLLRTPDAQHPASPCRRAPWIFTQSLGGNVGADLSGHIHILSKRSQNSGQNSSPDSGSGPVISPLRMSALTKL